MAGARRGAQISGVPPPLYNNAEGVMAKIWIQLLGTKQIEHRGALKTYHAGDWVEVGKQDALRWIADGSARALGREQLKLMPDSGIVVTGNMGVAVQWLGRELDVVLGEPRLAFPYTLIWNPSVRLKRELLPVGFHLLKTWEIAIPLKHYDTLACHLGTKEERDYTKSIIRDLRVPVYECGVIFAKRCPSVQKLLECWKSEQGRGNNSYLAFLRALYQIKPLVCALPVTWITKRDPWGDM